MAYEPQEQLTGAYLVIQQGAQLGKRVEVWKDCTTIGRSLDCDIFLEDLAVHRKQASILRTPSGYILRDDHGSGDSFVNGRPVREQLLNDGDKLMFGNTQLVFYGHEGTRPFQFASSRGRELQIGKKPDSSSNSTAKLDLASGYGTMRSFELLPDMTIGRSRECDIFLEDLSVSRHHATIHQLPDGSYELEDHRSATGTYVNGMRVTRYRLLEGDVVQIGRNSFTFRQGRS
jgi:pSer/pThr/pTyr-binding forkhead associated (FHA) protein